MTLGELVARLDELLEEGYDDETEVLIATQPSWPLQFFIAGVVSSSDLEADEDEHPHLGDSTIYLVEGGHPAHPYASRQLWDLI